MLRSRPVPILQYLLVLVAPLSTLYARAAPGPPPVLADALSIPELREAARGVVVGGSLRVEGLSLGHGARPEALDLVRFEVFAPDAEIVVHDEKGSRRLPAPGNVYLRGRVVGDPDSLAVLAFREAGGIRGLARSGDALYILGEESPRTANAAGNSRRLAGRRMVDPAYDTDRFSCGTDGLPAPAASLPLSPRANGATLVPRAQAGYYSARVAVETDWEFFQLFGDATAATDYVGDLMAYASSVYDRELDTELYVSYLSLWETSSDPWSQSDPTCGLLDFGRYWNDNRTGVGRTIAHFMSGKGLNAGVAWIGVLCAGPFQSGYLSGCPGLPAENADSFGGAYGYTGGLDGNFDPAGPSPVWDIVAVTHEIGHNFDSPHTHCYEGLGGSSDAVDHCTNQTGSTCYQGNDFALPDGCPGAGQGCGTIMSYCHFLSGGLSNIGLTLGTGHPYGVLPGRVPDRMRAHADATAQSSTCLDRITPCDDMLLENEIVSDTRTYEACATLRAGNGFEVAGPGGDVTLIGNRVILENGFVVQSGGTLVVEAE